MKSFLYPIGWLFLISLFGFSFTADAGEPELVFSVKTWEGDYATEDIPGGVKSTPSQGSIKIMNFDGTGLKQIVPPGSHIDFPTVSPDGKWVYFQSRQSGTHQIYRCKRDGSQITSLTSPEKLNLTLKGDKPFVVKDAYGYDLSTDGTRMVYTVHDGTSGRVVFANADGSEPSFIAPGRGYIYMARLNPANDRVVFSGPGLGYRLLLSTLPDGPPLELTPDHSDCFVPQFTPDGKSIVFIRRDGDVYRVGIDRKDFKRLTEGNNYVEFRLSPMDKHGSTDGPDISPDGRKIAYIARVNGVPNVFTMDLDGSNQRQITHRKTPCGRVRWSPDSRQLAFVSFEGKYPQLFTVPAKEGEPRQLTHLEGGVNFVKWCPHPKGESTAQSSLTSEPPGILAKKNLPLPGEVFSVAGHTAFLIGAKTNSSRIRKPWVWYAPTLPNLPGSEERWMFQQFLEAGIAIAGIDAGESYGSPRGNQLFSALYEEMTRNRGYSDKPVLLGRSRGGLQTLSWATQNPEKVGAFAGIYPVCNLASYPTVPRASGAFELKAEELQARLTEFNPIDRLSGLAKAKVHLFAIHGDVDTVVPLEANSGLVKERYTALDGSMNLVVPKGQGHNMWIGFFQSQALVDFVKAHAGPTLDINWPTDYQVFQRASREKGTIFIRGEFPLVQSTSPTIQARVVVNGKPGEWETLKAKWNQAKFQAEIDANAGGWYGLEIRALGPEKKVVAQSFVEHVGIGEVFVIAGQSNSANHGEEKQKPKNDRVVSFDGRGWKPAHDPQPGASGGGGSFLPPFGDEMANRFHVPVGLVACGVGATSVREWLPMGSRFPNPPTIEGNVTRLPNGEWESKGAIFAHFCERMKALGPNGFRTVLWHQGESDSNQKDPTRTLSGQLYRESLEKLIRQSRREIGWEAPWFVAQASYHVPGDEASPEIRSAQASTWKDGLAMEGPDTDQLKGSLRDSGGKGVHFSGQGLREHAAKWVEKVDPWLFKQK